MNELLSAVGSAWASLPAPVAAVLTMILGWLAAAALRLLASGLLALVRFDRLSERAGLAEFLRKGGVQYSPSKLVGAFAYWVVLLVALFLGARALDVRIANSIADRVIELLPSLLAAGMIAVLGAVLVSFTANFAKTIARNAGFRDSALLARSIRLVGDIIVITMALEQVGLGQTILSTLFLLAFAALALGAAIAFGLGSVDMAKDAMRRLIWTLREREREGGGGDLEG